MLGLREMKVSKARIKKIFSAGIERVPLALIFILPILRSFKDPIDFYQFSNQIGQYLRNGCWNCSCKYCWKNRFISRVVPARFVGTFAPSHNV